MTISYQGAINSSTVGGFMGVIFKYKGSLYQLIYKELFLFLSSYITLSIIYRQVLNAHQRE